MKNEFVFICILLFIIKIILISLGFLLPVLFFLTFCLLHLRMFVMTDHEVSGVRDITF